MPVAVIVNPALKAAGAAVREVTAACQRRGLGRPDVMPTSVESPGAEQAAKALADGATRIVVAGGDGTVRLVAGTMAAAPPGVQLGIVPIGSANIVARNLGVRPHDVASAAATAVADTSRPLSVGWVQCQTSGAWAAALPMLAVAGIGRDAQSIAAIRPWLKRRAGWLAYAEAGGRHACRPSLPMSLTLDDGPARAVRAWSVLVATLPRLPMGVIAFPDAAPGADAMQVLHVALRHPGQWASVAVKGLAHTAGDVEALRYSSARRVEVRPAHPLPVQIDGDLVPDVEAMRVHLQAAAVRVAVPGV